MEKLLGCIGRSVQSGAHGRRKILTSGRHPFLHKITHTHTHTHASYLQASTTERRPSRQGKGANFVAEGMRSEARPGEERKGNGRNVEASVTEGASRVTLRRNSVRQTGSESVSSRAVRSISCKCIYIEPYECCCVYSNRKDNGARVSHCCAVVAVAGGVHGGVSAILLP